MDSILIYIKKMLGITEEYEYFDPNVIMHINTTFSILNQLGVGPAEGYIIHDKSSKWSEFIKDNALLEMIKTYMYLKVQLLFDPPTSSASIDAINRQINELEWRINNIADSVNTEAKNFSDEINSMKQDIKLLTQHDILATSIQEEEVQNE